MSYDWAAWAWTVPDLTVAQRLVLLRLADRARLATGRAWPSVASLAADTGVSERTVQYALRRLEQRGVVDVAGAGGRGKTSTYTLTKGESDDLKGAAVAPLVDKNGATAAPFEDVKGATDDVKGATDDAKGATAAPEPGKNLERTRHLRAPTTKSVEQRITPELLPVAAPTGAGGDLAVGEWLDELIAEVGARRGHPLTRSEAKPARALAVEHLAVGRDPEEVIAALAATRAFTAGAVSFALGERSGNAEPRGAANLRAFAREHPE